MTTASFDEVFSLALRGHRCTVAGLGSGSTPLPVEDWTRAADDDDLTILDLCDGPVVDLGCGPGRMTAALLERGVAALGVDLNGEAVEQTIRRGGSALQRDLFAPLPAEGRWGTALLVDGNIGIGGDPASLLRRALELVLPGGRVVVELAAPGVPQSTRSAVLHCGDLVTDTFPWSVVGVDDIRSVAASAGLVVGSITTHSGRWCAVLHEDRSASTLGTALIGGAA